MAPEEGAPKGKNKQHTIVVVMNEMIKIGPSPQRLGQETE